MKSHIDLLVWKESISFVTEIYRITEDFPKSENFGITSQIRRSAVSIPSNIAEGAARSSYKEFLHFLSISFGSAAELETQLIISKNLNYLDNPSFIKMNLWLETIRKMMVGLKKSILKRQLP